jgi:hypothetical protein
MNDMFGIEQLWTGNAERLVALSRSRAPSGRINLFGTFSQGIALMRSALGFIRLAFQANH